MTTVIWSKPEAEREGTPLLVMMHGYGTNETRMAEHFSFLPREFTCASLRAPMDMDGGYGWFLLDYFHNNDFADVVASASGVMGWIDSVKGRHSSVSLLGFSQGMAMATTVLRLRPEGFAAVVGLSGFVLDNDLLAVLEPLEPKVPFFWGRDKVDYVINAEAIGFTKRWLRENTELTAATYPDMGHTIELDELADVAKFLTRKVLTAGQP